MTKKKEIVELTQTATIPDKEVLRAKLKKLITEIDEKLVKLGIGQTPPSIKTSGLTFKMNEMDSGGNIITNLSDLCYLIKALSRLKEVKTSFLNEVARLELTITPTITWSGVNIDNWIHDLEIRISQVANVKQIQDLKDSKAKLELFLSEEDRLIKTLGDVSGLLGIKQNLLV